MFGLSHSAKAQEATGNPKWAVLDFVNNSGYGGAEIGRQAADAFDVQLYNSKNTEVVNRSEIRDAKDHFGLQYPLDLLDLQRVGQYVEAQSIVSGEVLAISKNGSKGIEAVVAVRVNDVATGELVNGALAKGVSVSRVGGVDEDAMVTEAIDKAVSLAVSRMQRYTIPIGTIKAYEGNDSVILNKGSRDGYFVGLNMMTLRSGKETGQIRISSLDSDSSVATITNIGVGIEIADRCHALFHMPAYKVVAGGRVVTDEDITTTNNFSKKRAKFSKIGGILVAILAAAVLIYLARRGNSTGSLSGAYVGSVVAQACNALRNSTPSTVATENGVMITWNYGNLSYQNILSFNVYRNPTGTFSAGGNYSASSVTYSITSASGLYSSSLANVPVWSSPNNSRIGLDDSESIRTVAFEYVVTGYSSTTGTSSSGGSGGGSGSGGQGLTIGTLYQASGFDVAGVAMGNPYEYAVTAVYKTWDGYLGETNYQESPVSAGMSSGYATPLSMIDNSTVTVNTSSMSNQYTTVGHSSSAVTIAWKETLYADEYILDVATNKSFTDKHTYVLKGTGITGVGQSETLTFSSIFSSPTQVFFRIGERCSTDVPGPYADSGKFPNPDKNANGGNYIYEPYCLIMFTAQ
jgi:hypothetical protein